MSRSTRLSSCSGQRFSLFPKQKPDLFRHRPLPPGAGAAAGAGAAFPGAAEGEARGRTSASGGWGTAGTGEGLPRQGALGCTEARGGGSGAGEPRPAERSSAEIVQCSRTQTGSCALGGSQMWTRLVGDLHPECTCGRGRLQASMENRTV